MVLIGTNHHFHIAMMNSSKAVCLIILSVVFLPIQSCCALSSSSSFHGMQIINPTTYHATAYKPRRPSSNSLLVMRKQKASDKRTARMQRGVIDNAETTFTQPSLSSSTTQILNSSPMTKSKWKHKKVELRAAGEGSSSSLGSRNGNNNNNMGRGRARKRLKLYNSLASYHFTFLEMIQEEYQMEVYC